MVDAYQRNEIRTKEDKRKSEGETKDKEQSNTKDESTGQRKREEEVN